MHRGIKQTLLKVGGYRLAADLSCRYEEIQLRYHVRRLPETGILRLPDYAMFEPTQRCNLDCKMCFQDRTKMIKGDELPLSQIRAFFEENRCLKKVTLIGGEPFVRRDILDLIQYLNESRDVVVCTNGTLLDAREWEFLCRCKRLISVCISLDGPREVHEAIRGKKGCYDAACRTIAALAPAVPVTVNCVLQEETLPVLGELVDICAALGVRKLKLELERLYGSANQHETIKLLGLGEADLPHSSRGRSRNYKLEELRCALREAALRGQQAGIYVFPDPPYLTDALSDCYENSLRQARKCLCHSLRTATIAPDGSLLFCFNIRVPFGKITEQSLKQLWNSETAVSFRAALASRNFSPQCENCPFLVPVSKIQQLLSSGAR